MDPDVVQPYRNVVDDTYEVSGLKAWVEDRDAGVAFFSPLRHGLLLGKYERPPDFGAGDFRSGIDAFNDPEELRRLREVRRQVEARFADHPEPTLHVLVGALLTDTPSGCALVGLRDTDQAEAAGKIGEPLSDDEVAWVRSVYRSQATGAAS